MNIQEEQMKQIDEVKDKMKQVEEIKVDVNMLNTSVSNSTIDKDEDSLYCRVCQCSEPDKMGDAAIGFLNIIPPQDTSSSSTNADSSSTGTVAEKDYDIELGICYQQDALISLGCSCKNDLALAHYACALKWFINHGSTVCEICGVVAKNIRPVDIKKIMVSLKKYESLKDSNADESSDSLASVRRQRLSEVSIWFNPRSNTGLVAQADQALDIPVENVDAVESATSKWAVEGTGILVATSLLTVTLAMLISPHLGTKKNAITGLSILLGGVCALIIVVVFRFVILPRIKYGPARYWAVLFVFWFLVFGIWASRTHVR